MMAQEIKLRKTSANWREYLRDTRESLGVLRWVWQELVPPESKRWSRWMLFFSMIQVGFVLVAPLLISSMIDALVARDLSLAFWSLGGIAVVNGVAILFDWRLMRAREMMMGELWIEVDNKTSELFMSKSLGQHLRDGSALSIGNVEKGRNQVLMLAESIMFGSLDSIFKTLLAYVFIWFLSPAAGGIVTVVVVGFLITSVFLNRRASVAMAPVEYAMRKLNRERYERWDKIERVKTSGKETEENARIRSWETQVIREQDRSFWLWFLGFITARGLVQTGLLTLILALGVWNVWAEAWTVGLLYPLMSWTRHFEQNVWRLGEVERRINRSAPAVKGLKDALSLEPDIVDVPNAVPLAPDKTPPVALSLVSHYYRKASIEENDAGEEEVSDQPGDYEKQPILNGVSLTIEPGQKVALLGPSGAGKTTVMRLLQRYFDPAEGSVIVDNHNLRQIELVSWQRLVSYVSQQPQVLDGTIRSNLTYALSAEERERITDDEVWALVRKLKIDFGERLTDGLDTKVGPRGIKLSGGEQQRLMVGAAAMKKPRFWIIDEATSSLDSTTEKAVQDGLAEVMEAGTSALVIAHRLSTVRHLCDKFVVLSQNGHGSRVEAEASSFEELYRISPTFRQLADDQDLAIDTAAPQAT
jgi:ABC-type multidrug transport system fused ATPase/permease subunit